MLDGIFVSLFLIGFILTIIAEEQESIVYSMISLIIWLVLFPQSLWITDVGGTTYNEFGLSAICLGFVLVNVILLILHIMAWKKKDLTG